MGHYLSIPKVLWLSDRKHKITNRTLVPWSARYVRRSWT